MAHFYPKHLEDFPYVGKHSYALEFTTEGGVPRLPDPDATDLVVRQIHRAAHERAFLVTHCVMPDHIHLVVDGQGADSDCLAFIKAAKQYPEYSSSDQARLGTRLGMSGHRETWSGAAIVTTQYGEGRN